MENPQPFQNNSNRLNSCEISPIPKDSSLALTEEFRYKLEQLHIRLENRISDLRNGSLKQQKGVWLNSSAACPVPASVLKDIEQALLKPHATIGRGTDARTQEINSVSEKFCKDFCKRYAKGAGAVILGYNTTHMLLALGRAILKTRPHSIVAHGDPDHKASYAFSSLAGWHNRVLIPYLETGFYEQYSTETLPNNAVFLINALHHMHGTMQTSVLPYIPQTTMVVVDLSQALSNMPPEQLTPFMSRADAAVFNIGKTFSPLSTGVLWVRDIKLAQAVLECNPELRGSVSSLQIEALTSAGKFLSESVDEDWYEYIWYLTRYALVSLSQLAHVSVIGCNSWQSDTDKLGIISINIDYMSAQELGMYLDSKGFAVRADGSCTGNQQTKTNYDHVRISLLPHVAPKDIDALVQALKECA